MTRHETDPNTPHDVAASLLALMLGAASIVASAFFFHVV